MEQHQQPQPEPSHAPCVLARRRGEPRGPRRGRAIAADTPKSIAMPNAFPLLPPSQGAAEARSPSRPLWIALGLMGLGMLVFLHLTGRPHHWLTFHPNADKIEHIIAFGGAMLWFGQLFRRGMERAFFCLSLILAGVSLEYVQHALGHYDPVEYGDMAADALGALLGMLLLRTRLGTVLHVLDRKVGRVTGPKRRPGWER